MNIVAGGAKSGSRPEPLDACFSVLSLDHVATPQPVPRGTHTSSQTSEKLGQGQEPGPCAAQSPELHAQTPAPTSASIAPESPRTCLKTKCLAVSTPLDETCSSNSCSCDEGNSERQQASSPVSLATSIEPQEAVFGSCAVELQHAALEHAKSSGAFNGNHVQEAAHSAAKPQAQQSGVRMPLDLASQTALQRLLHLCQQQVRGLVCALQLAG